MSKVHDAQEQDLMLQSELQGQVSDNKSTESTGSDQAEKRRVLEPRALSTNSLESLKQRESRSGSVFIESKY